METDNTGGSTAAAAQLNPPGSRCDPTVGEAVTKGKSSVGAEVMTEGSEEKVVAGTQGGSPQVTEMEPDEDSVDFDTFSAAVRGTTVTKGDKVCWLVGVQGSAK